MIPPMQRLCNDIKPQNLVIVSTVVTVLIDNFQQFWTKFKQYISIILLNTFVIERTLYLQKVEDPKLL